MAIIGICKYWDLGRGKAKGTFKINAKDSEDFNNQLYDEFSKHLLSSDISFNDGKIFAGFHTVGEFAFVAKERGQSNETNWML